MSILKTLIKLGRVLDMGVVVEGVETLEQMRFLERSHCDIIQGYYLGYPMDAKCYQLEYYSTVGSL